MGNERQTAPTNELPHPRADGLLSWSFIGLLAAQFLGSVNANMFRWLVVPIGKHQVGEEHAATALSAGLMCFVLPYLLLAAPAGYLADRFSKRTVIVQCKLAEIVIALLGVAAIWYGNPWLLFAVVALLGSQSALFSPAKLGAIPEILPPDKISAGNGIIGLMTVVAIVAGSVMGGYLFAWTGPDGRRDLWISAAALLGIAVTGWLTSLLVTRLTAADPSRPPPIHMLRETIRDLATLAKNGPLLRVALGTAFFWSVGALAQMNVDYLAVVDLGWRQEQVGPLLGALAIGVAIGSVLAGWWSEGRVQLGIVPLGAVGIALASLLLAGGPEPLEPAAATWAYCWLFALGLSAGLFSVPLAAYLQHRSEPRTRGSILAASNFLTFAGMLGAGALFWLLRSPLGLSAREIFLVAGVLTVPVAGYVLCLLPQATLRFIVWLATKTIYRLRVYGHENLPERGGAVLVANHVSYMDALFLLMSSSRPIRMIAYAPYVSAWWSRWVIWAAGVIPIGKGPKSIREALQTARQAVENGELVCIFPEGSMTRTGQLQAFKPGFTRLLEATHAPVVPVYLDELWGSIFSAYGGRFFWKWPRRWPYPVTIVFGRPLSAPFELHRVRVAVQELGVSAVETRKERKLTLPRTFLRNCRKSRWRAKVADSTGEELTGNKLLLRTLIVRRLLLREVLSADERYVGVLLPPSIAGVLVNAALPLANRIAVNLNYTLSPENINHCIRECGIRHVLTSRKVMEKLKIELEAELVYLEDFKAKVTTSDKLIAATQAYVTPIRVLERLLGLRKVGFDDVLTVIFTSGSTATPKGVMLTHHNVASNIEGIDQVIQLNADDVTIGVLPFFHSYGYTATMWTVLALKPKGVYHFSPLDAQQVGKLCREHRVTVFMATPTFLRNYLKRCQREDFAAIDVVFASAEKLPRELSDAFEQKFGVRPSEAYGATELSPLVSVNVPPSRAHTTDQPASKEGTVGRPIPGVAAKVVHPETGEDRPSGEAGLLLIKGANVMKGYLNHPDLTAKVMRDGWYVTGDIAIIDADGFIQITGRESRFSKIGGEMVPHIKIEEILQTILGADPDELKVVVTAVPDARKGERLIVIHKPIELQPEQVCRELAKAGLPNLWIPSQDSFYQVDEIPVLGTGKLDLKGLKQLAMEKFGGVATPG